MTLTLLEKEHLADNVWAFRFKPGEPLVWVPGQFVRVELPHDNPDKEGTKRWFTDSAAPYDGILQITTRVTNSTFKQALSKLELGSTELQLIEKPEGDFVWQDSSMPLIFVAGGIGVTPFHSILRQRAHDKQPIPVTLIYGGRTSDLPFKAEFDEIMKDNPDLKVHYVIGQPLTADSLMGIDPMLHESLVYVSGPEPMVEALGKDLLAKGLPKEQLKQDFFPNYNETNY